LHVFGAMLRVDEKGRKKALRKIGVFRVVLLDDGSVKYIHSHHHD
jgi:hypothetical protein